MTPNQDERLLAQQFETIFTKYYSVVKYFALMLLKSEEDAKDITQDVFTKLWTKPELWTEVPNPTPYIYTLTKSTRGSTNHQISSRTPSGATQNDFRNESFQAYEQS